MRREDYIPESDMDFSVWAGNLIRSLGAGLGRFGFPANVYAQLKQLYEDFMQKYETALEPVTRTKPSIRTKNTARDTLKKAIRQAVKEYLAHNHSLTDGDRKALGLPVYKTTRTPSPVAGKAPHLNIEISVICRVIIHFYDREGGRKKAKPAGQQSAEIAWVISSTPPTRWEELLHYDIDTRTPFTLSFEHNQRGQTVYFALRWVNTRGEKGPWSNIHSAIIP
jgi:hypothetical protein